MGSRRLTQAAVAALSVAAAFLAPKVFDGSGSGAATSGRSEVDTVSRIVDGDTLYVDGIDQRIRLIGMDAPEVRHPERGVECFGHEAADRLEDLVPAGTKVRIEWDAERLDRHGRPLGYIYRVQDGVFVNERMVRDGFASALPVPPNTAHEATIDAAEREAQRAGRGMWSSCRASPAVEPGGNRW